MRGWDFNLKSSALSVSIRDKLEPLCKCHDAGGWWFPATLPRKAQGGKKDLELHAWAFSFNPVNPNFKKIFAAPWSALHYGINLMMRHNLIPLKFVQFDTEDHDNDFVSHVHGPVTSKLHSSFPYIAWRLFLFQDSFAFKHIPVDRRALLIKSLKDHKL